MAHSWQNSDIWTKNQAAVTNENQTKTSGFICSLQNNLKRNNKNIKKNHKEGSQLELILTITGMFFSQKTVNIWINCWLNEWLSLKSKLEWNKQDFITIDIEKNKTKIEIEENIF